MKKRNAYLLLAAVLILQIALNVIRPKKEPPSRSNTIEKLLEEAKRTDTVINHPN